MVLKYLPTDFLLVAGENNRETRQQLDCVIKINVIIKGRWTSCASRCDTLRTMLQHPYGQEHIELEPRENTRQILNEKHSLRTRERGTLYLKTISVMNDQERVWNCFRLKKERETGQLNAIPAPRMDSILEGKIL